jgi:acyl-coenzyme A thioesterase PaaI-like protein
MSELGVLATGPEAMFGVGAVASVDGSVVGSMPTGAPFTGPDGRPAPGALGVLVDDVLGYAIIDSLPPGSWSVSTEIWIDLLAPLPADGSRVHAEARAVQAGSFATGRVVDAEGRLLAECRERGREIADGPDAGDLPAFELPDGVVDLAELIGLRADGDRLTLDVTPVLGNPRRMLHGGVSLCASELAATRSRQADAPRLVTTSLHIVHARPVPAGARMEFDVTTRHAGRSLWISDVVGSVAGRPCTLARVSAQAPMA